MEDFIKVTNVKSKNRRVYLFNSSNMDIVLKMAKRLFTNENKW